MRLGIDVTVVRGDRITGIERYAIDIVHGIARVASANLRFVLYVHPGGLRHFNGLPRNFELMVSPWRNRVVVDQLWLPWAILRSDVDLVYFTTIGVPLIKSKPFVLIVHDVAGWLLPSVMSRGMRYYYKPLLSLAMRSQRLIRVITISEHSRNDIIEVFGLPAERIEVIYRGIAAANFCGSNATPVPSTQVSRVAAKYGLPSTGYILAVGTLEPRKNITRLLEAFALLVTEYGVDEHLVVVGRKGWGRQPSVPPHVLPRVHFVGFVADEDLPAIYSGAKLFVFPSLYEGFGLPVLEAMACGVPVVASATSSIPEVGGEACMYFDPYDVGAIAHSLYRVIQSRTLREELVRKGGERVRKFDWEGICQRTLQVLLSACQDRRKPKQVTSEGQ